MPLRRGAVQTLAVPRPSNLEGKGALLTKVRVKANLPDHSAEREMQTSSFMAQISHTQAPGCCSVPTSVGPSPHYLTEQLFHLVPRGAVINTPCLALGGSCVAPLWSTHHSDVTMVKWVIIMSRYVARVTGLSPMERAGWADFVSGLYTDMWLDTTRWTRIDTSTELFYQNLLHGYIL